MSKKIKHKQNNSHSSIFIIAWILFIAIAICALIRLHYGVSVGDEAFMVADSYLPLMKGKWFEHEFAIHQMSTMLFTPFLWFYDLLFGTEGMIKFVRYLHFILTLVTASSLFMALKKISNPAIALLLSAVVISYIPNGIASLSYNTMSSLFFIMAVSFGFLAFTFSEKNKLNFFAILSGFCWVLSVYCYPLFLVCFILFVIALALLTFNDKTSRKHILIPFMMTTVAFGIVGLLWLMSFGINNILRSIELAKTFNSPGSFWKLEYAYKMLWTYFPNPIVTYGYLAIWLVVAKLKPTFNEFFFLGFLLLFFVFGGTYEAMPVQVLYPAMQVLLFLYLFTTRKLETVDKNIIWLIFIPSIIGSIAGCLSSRMTIYAMSLTGVCGAIYTTALFLKNAKLPIAAVIVLTLNSASLYEYYNSVYEDDQFEQLNSEIQSGPFKGLYTHANKAEFIHHLQSDLQQFKIQNRTVVFRDFFPGGFLMAPNIPLGPTVYISPANFYPESRPLYLSLYQDQKYWPEVVVELAYYEPKKGTFWVFRDRSIEGQDPFMDFFMQTGKYKVLVDRGIYRFLIRNDVML